MITAWIGSITFLGVIILYTLLAMGLPYGEFAMGGRYKILPKSMRVACVVSIGIQAAAILFLLQAGNVISLSMLENAAIGVCYFFAAYLLLNTGMNALSKSKKEKYVMTPLSLLTAICFLITAMYG